jgi:hypothetical protein
MKPADAAIVVVCVVKTVVEAKFVEVTTTFVVVLSVIVSLSVDVMVSVSTGSVVVVLTVTVVDVVVVEVAGVVVRNGVDVIILTAYQGSVKILESVFTGDVAFGPCFVKQVTKDFVLTCADTPVRSTRAESRELTSMML